MGLSEEVRSHCAQVAASARSVRIDATALGAVRPAPPPELDPVVHYLEGSAEDVARYLLALDAINFGSGWFPLLDKRASGGDLLSGYFTVAWNMSDDWRANGPWSAADLRAMTTERIAGALRQRAGLELMSLFAQALRELGRLLGSGGALDLVAAAGGSAQALAARLASECTLFADRGFYKRAQIAANDLALAGVASFGDLDDLTIFADNLVPHVLRCDGVLVYDAALAAHIDGGMLLPAGRAEHEIRACAVHACELLAQRTGVAPRVLDVWLWNRGQAPEYKARPRHRTRTVFY
jgi:Queuosine salvage protein